MYRQLDLAIEAAVRTGGTAAQEDDSNGYALINDPNARSLQLRVHAWALEYPGELIQVLRSSSSVEDRRIASDALGYARQSAAQIRALAQAARDPDDEVRNNATRALGVLVRSDQRLSAHIAPEIFIAMLNSPAWSDRNKACALLVTLSADRNPDFLNRIRAIAEDSLLEMAAWQDTSHAYAARMILGRVAGIPEDRLRRLAWNGPVSSILSAAKRRSPIQ
jgi:HEAT repeat protein